MSENNVVNSFSDLPLVLNATQLADVLSISHATASFTLDVYGHVSQKMRQQSADRMEQFIQGLPVPVRL